jgi:hypothetical protein
VHAPLANGVNGDGCREILGGRDGVGRLRSLRKQLGFAFVVCAAAEATGQVSSGLRHVLVFQRHAFTRLSRDALLGVVQARICLRLPGRRLAAPTDRFSVPLTRAR